MRKKMKTLPLLILCLVTYLAYTRACNEGQCASLVSKCLLIKSCECDMTDKGNCSCCRNCSMCLSQLYTECCSCVGMCKKNNPTPSPRASTIDDLPDPIPDLFNVLTEEIDPLDRWSVFTYPAIYDPRFIENENVPRNLHMFEQQGVKLHSALNCTVAFMAECYSLPKCKASCMSMGASRLRWFHEHGCCQCVSHACLDYGLSRAKCARCPPPDQNPPPDPRKSAQKDGLNADFRRPKVVEELDSLNIESQKLVDENIGRDRSTENMERP